MARVKISRLPNNRGLGWYSGNSINRDGDHGVRVDARMSIYEGLVVPDGRLMVPTIPTSDPGVPNRLWSNGGVLEVSQTKPSITTHRAAWFYSDGISADGLRLEDCRTGIGSTREKQPGRSLVLNGSNQYVAGPTATSPTTWSAACWVYPLAVGAYDAIFSNRTSGINWYIGTNDSNQLYVAGDGTAIASGTTDFVVNTWQHLAITYNGTTIIFYRNGVQVASSAFAPTITGGSVQMRIGYDQPNASYYNARLSEAYWAPGQVLTAAQVLSLYEHEYVTISSANGFFLKLDQPNSALQMDSCGNGNHGTIANWATGVHYEGSDVPYSWQDEVGFSADNGTNLIASPNDFSGWTAQRVTYSGNQEYEPSGNTLVADRFLETTDNNSHFIETSVNFGETANGKTAWTFVCDVKGISRSDWQVILYDNSYAQYISATFNATTVAATGYSAPGTWLAGGREITSLGGGWYRLKLTVIPVSGATSLRPLVLSHNGSGVSYAGDTAKGFYIANAKLVKGSLHTPRNEANTAQDVIGNSLQHTGHCPARAKLVESNCLTLNGSNQYVNVGTGTWDTDGTQAMEVSGYFKTSTSSGMTLIGNILSSGTYRGWEVFVNGGQLILQIINTVTTNHLSVGTVFAGLADGNWKHFRITYDGSRTPGGVAIYVDGIRQALATATNTLSATSAGGGAASVLGARNAAGVYFNGSVAGMKVTIGSTVWEYTCAEGGSALGIYERRGGTYHAITNAGANWAVKQNVYHANIINGQRSGVNLFTHSQALTNWASPQSTATDNVTTAPDGTSTASQLSNDAAAGMDYHYLWMTGLQLTQGVTYTLSAYVKPKTGSGWIWLLGETSTDVFCYFNVSTGVAGTATGWTNQTITSVGSGWYRVSATFTKTSATATEQIGIGVASVGTQPNWNSVGLANTQQVYVWGMQLEVGSSVSDYFHTKEVSGNSYINALHGSTTLAANGLALTQPAGDWNNDAETNVDATCGVSTSTAWAGKTVPTSYEYGDSLSGSSLQRRTPNSIREDRYRIPA